MTVRRFLLPLLVGCATLAVAAPAGATSPEHFRFPFTDSVPDLFQCDGFVIGLEGTGTTDVTIFSDASGEVIKFLVITQSSGTMTNSVTGKSIVVRSEYQQLFTRIDDTDEFTHSLVGFRYIGTAPREGLVIQDVGRLEYSPGEEELLFSAGHHFDVPGEDAGPVFCAAVA
jgi:hypothetical protein